MTEWNEAGPTEARRETLSVFYRALGHPARLNILTYLARRPEACCGEIVAALPLAQSTISQHLQVLKEAGLVTCRAHGRTCRYRLDPDVLATALRLSETFLHTLADGGTQELELAPGVPEEDVDPPDPGRSSPNG